MDRQTNRLTARLNGPLYIYNQGTHVLDKITTVPFFLTVLQKFPLSKANGDVIHGMIDNDGDLHVQNNGFYYLYIQMIFIKPPDAALNAAKEGAIYVNDRPISYFTVEEFVNTAIWKVFSGNLHFLKKTDAVNLRVKNWLAIRKNLKHVFFGAFKIVWKDRDN